jgi:DNA-binding transcriptional LysR family regulator
MGGMPRATPEAGWVDTIARHARVVGRVNGRMPMAKMVRAGIAIGCLPRLVGDGEGLRLLDAPDPPERQLWMGVHRDVRAIPRVRGTLDFLAETFAGLRNQLRP